VKAAAGGVFTVLSQYDNTISRLHAVEARAAVSDAPDEEKEEMEKVYSDDSENVSSGSSSSSDSGASGDGEESSADELNAASPPEEKNYVAPTTPDEPDQHPIPVRMASLCARMILTGRSFYCF
jgi:hypothetical protein